MRWFVVVLGLCLAAPVANADVMSGHDLKKACDQASGNDATYGLCHGYVIGIADAMHRSAVDIYGWRTCMSNDVTVEAMVKAVRAFLAANSQYLDLDADSLVARGLADAYPCN